MIYDKYKPFRNYIRQFNLTVSLHNIWHYSQHLLNNKALPKGFTPSGQQPIKNLVRPWELNILLREIILHASSNGEKNLNTYGDLIKAINKIRELENEISEVTLEPSQILSELHRVAHHQFPWQQRRDMATLMRYLKIFGEDAFQSVLIRETGLSMLQLYFLGMAIAGHLEKNWIINTLQDYSQFGISADMANGFFKKMSINIHQLKELTQCEQCYDDRWPYTWNPIEGKPFISFDLLKSNFVCCPMPLFLIKKITYGIFYELISAANFDNAYGISFQNYVGEVIREIYTFPLYSLMDERPYNDGKNIKHGVDWILADNTANIFVECKTKRLNQEAKITLNGNILDSQFDVMAGAIVQIYKNIIDAINGKSNWSFNKFPIYPLVITLEDWFLFSPPIVNRLNEKVMLGLIKASIDENVLETMPYTVASIDEFELVSQVIASVGIQHFFSKKTSITNRGIMLRPFTWTAFETEFKNANHQLFESDWHRLIPSMAKGWVPEIRPEIL